MARQLDALERVDDAVGPLHPALQIRGLSKAFGGTPALSDVELTVAAATVHALLGENGSGKSTLIKSLSGYHAPDPGAEILIGGIGLQLGSPGAAHGLGCRFVHQDLGLIDSCSIADNIALTSGFPSVLGALRSGELRRRTRRALERVGLDLDPDRLVGGLPAAVRTGVALARALADADGAAVRLLVLDEPTATLPDSEVRHLLTMVRAAANSGVGVLYVTHHLDEVFQIADDVSVLRDGRKVVTTRADQLTREELVSHLLGHQLDESHGSIQPVSPDGADAVVQVAELVAGTLRSVSFSVASGEIVGIAGLTGSGRESVLPAIFGGIPRESGSVRVDGAVVRAGRPDRGIRAGMALVPADRVRQGVVMTMSARENLTLARLRPHWRVPMLRRRSEIAETRLWFERLDVRPAGAVDRNLATFSGGNQQKVVFGKWLRCTPRVLLLDEPTQGVDIGAKAEIHRHIVAAVGTGAAAVVSSSDYEELAALCHRVIVLRGGRVVAELAGSAVTVSEMARQALGSEGEQL